MNSEDAFYRDADDQRPAPEAFLRMIERSRRGRLKVYIGHAAGTGKTVQMLREANTLRRRGHDVVGAYIETHGRLGTDAELGELAIIPRKRVTYKGTTIEELNIDAVIARKPEIAIVDELPHTNTSECSKNRKRWQDIDDLLDAGISVITTMNIQHLESLGPVIEKITGVKVTETVPDSFVASADQIVNIDIPPSELRGRMRRGEIYAPEKVETALENFFTTNNLTNLRELALREVVRFLDQARPTGGNDRPIVDERGSITYQLPHEGEHANGPPVSPLKGALSEVQVDPVVMVAMSSRPPDVRNLLRKAATIAHRLNTHWYLVYVETPSENAKVVNATTQRILMNNIMSAKDLGATVFRLKGTDVAASLASFASEYGVTHAIFGATEQPTSIIGTILRPFRRDTASKFHELAPQVDLHICGRRSDAD